MSVFESTQSRRAAAAVPAPSRAPETSAPSSGWLCQTARASRGHGRTSDLLEVDTVGSGMKKSLSLAASPSIFPRRQSAISACSPPASVCSLARSEGSMKSWVGDGSGAESSRGRGRAQSESARDATRSVAASPSRLTHRLDIRPRKPAVPRLGKLSIPCAVPREVVTLPRSYCTHPTVPVQAGFAPLLKPGAETAADGHRRDGDGRAIHSGRASASDAMPGPDCRVSAYLNVGYVNRSAIRAWAARELEGCPHPGAPRGPHVGGEQGRSGFSTPKDRPSARF